ncbi:MAG: ATPase [Actinobacteria bacterium]|nr:ATPase [Actinomycetota bacterium]
MRSLLWFVMGVSGGFVLAHLVNKDPRGHEVMAELDARVSEFTDRMGDAYRDQQAQFEGLVDSAMTAASDALDTAKDAASHAVDAVHEAASTAVDSTHDAATDALGAAKNVAKKITD